MKVLHCPNSENLIHYFLLLHNSWVILPGYSFSEKEVSHFSMLGKRKKKSGKGVCSALLLKTLHCCSCYFAWQANNKA